MTSRDIRLLRILPGYLDSPVRCTLRIHSLGDRPVYEALSYTWGFSTKGLAVEVNEKSMPVTDNLGSALRRLRSMDKPRILWIDAICINQMDVDERNHQVSMMGDIYAVASQVLVWLGDSDVPRVDPESPFMHRSVLATNSETHWSLEDRQVRAFLAAIKATVPSWWHRLWVVQETILANSDPVICFSSFEMPWKELHSLLSTLKDSYPQDFPQEFMRSLETLKVLKQLHAAEATTLFGLMLLTAGRTSAEKRDGVFSTRNLLSPTTADLIPVDYTLSQTDICTHTTFAALATEPDFGLWHLLQIEAMRPKKAPGPPSWEVRFMSSFSTRWFKSHSLDELRRFAWHVSKVNTLHTCHNTTQLHLCMDKEKGLLICHGFVVDRIRLTYREGIGRPVCLARDKVAHFITDVMTGVNSALRFDADSSCLRQAERARSLCEIVFSSLHHSWKGDRSGRETFEQVLTSRSINETSESFYRNMRHLIASARRHSIAGIEELRDTAKDDTLKSQAVRFFDRMLSVTERFMASYLTDMPKFGLTRPQFSYEVRNERKEILELFYSVGGPALNMYDDLTHDPIDEGSDTKIQTRLTINIMASLKKITTNSQTDASSQLLTKVREAVAAWFPYCLHVAGEAQMYCTDAGVIGVGLGGIQEGDVVALLGSEPCPVILRPRGDHFEFGGFTYIPTAEYLADEEFQASEFVLC